MNADLQRILDKATELFDMMSAVENKWAAQGKATAVYVLLNARMTMEAELNAAVNDTAQPVSSPLHIGTFPIADEQSPDKPDAPKRGKR